MTPRGTVLVLIPLIAGLAGPVTACTVTTEGGSPSSTKPPAVTITVPGAKPSPRPSGTTAVLPNVVGMNHQTAQDTMQAHGFWRLREEDATGQHRLLILDRNWVVVSQQPRGGSRVPLDTSVLLRSKKRTDP
jgi:hypothetical protein